MSKIQTLHDYERNEIRNCMLAAEYDKEQYDRDYKQLKVSIINMTNSNNIKLITQNNRNAFHAERDVIIISCREILNI
jgi:hypothetical protein